MNVSKQRLGQYIPSTVMGETVRAFLPPPLPPVPAIDLGQFYERIDRANQVIGRLDGVSTLLPDPSLFLYFYVRKEALLSSQIEGTQSSLSDLLLFESQETPGTPIDDVEEVSNYVAAMNYGLERLESGFPLSLRLIREIHAVLMRGGRGATKQPGDFRRSQNWIGGTRPGNAIFVPPPIDKMDECLSDLERFLHDDRHKLPVLVRAALAHVQFETIHPFLDGNGRLGRLLITLILCNAGLMQEPILYLSLYFKTHRDQYYELLNRVRSHGDWESWLAFFLDGVSDVATGASESAKRILNLFECDRIILQAEGRRASTLLRVHEHFQKHPYSGVSMLAEHTKLSFPAANSAIETMVAKGILKEATGRSRDRVFAYSAYLAILSEGAEPIR